MSRLRAVLFAAAATVLVAGCGSDSTTSPASAPSTTGAPSGSGAPATTTGDTSAMSGTTLPAASGTTMVDNTPTPPASGPVQIDVLVGTDSGPDRVERVAKGAEITLNITNPDAADEYHVHMVDMERKVAKGVEATFNFTADASGTIEVESHVTNKVLITIEVV